MQAKYVLFVHGKKRQVRLTHSKTVEQVAKFVLRERMKEEGDDWSKEGILSYCSGYMEDYNQMRADDGYEPVHEFDQIVDMVAYNLFFSNAPHILDENKVELPSSYRERCAEVIVTVLESITRGIL